ncbi:MAG: hypothetical protein FWC89_03750 [Defluviitaleaceae bacterium]|nr:hypothetical protein [Defluviitaleaceae bacterium]
MFSYRIGADTVKTVTFHLSSDMITGELTMRVSVVVQCENGTSIMVGFDGGLENQPVLTSIMGALKIMPTKRQEMV